MSSLTIRDLRNYGYIFTLVLHLSNSMYMMSGGDPSSYKDVRIRTFGELRHRFLTNWNWFLQCVYAVTGLICENLEKKNMSNKNYQLPKYLRGFRDTLFSAIVFPTTFVVFTFFWSLFLYDRDLILPAYIDQFLTPLSNHVLHTAIVPIVLWELALRQRRVPKTHVRNIAHLAFHGLLYTSVLVYTYIDKGIWLYPIFQRLYDTVYLYFLFVGVGLMFITFYFLQWPLTKLLGNDIQSFKTKIK